MKLRVNGENRTYNKAKDEIIYCRSCGKELKTALWFCGSCSKPYCHECLINNKESCVCALNRAIYHSEHQFIKCDVINKDEN